MHCASSKPPSPLGLPGEADGGEVGSGPYDHSGAEVQLYRVVSVQRLPECGSPACIRLQVIVQDTVDGGTTAEVVGPVERSPELGSEVVVREVDQALARAGIPPLRDDTKYDIALRNDPNEAWVSKIDAHRQDVRWLVCVRIEYVGTQIYSCSDRRLRVDSVVERPL